MELPQPPFNWKKLAVIAAAAVITVAVAAFTLSGGGPVEGSSGALIMWRSTEGECMAMFRLHAGDMQFSGVDSEFIATTDFCVLDRKATDADTEGRESVGEMLKSAGDAVRGRNEPSNSTTGP